MRKIVTIFAALIFTATLWAQAPQKMSYQAVIRDAGGNLVISKGIGMQISILQGITPVYQETQTPITNANGLVTLEIGTGSVVSGVFASINWAAGVYSITTEIDPTSKGGTNYSITCTSQLLSVPYALTAAKVTGTQASEITANTAKISYPATDAIKLAGIAAGAEVNVNADWNATTGDAQILNKPTIPTAADGSETKLSAGTNVTVTGAGTGVSPYVINSTVSTLAIGQSYQGGIIFWLDAAGKHGLIAATVDNGQTKWFNNSYVSTSATIDAIYGGKVNTTKIVNIQTTGIYAAQICADYSVTVNNEYFDDWYLPSRYELALLATASSTVGGFQPTYYWSSTETSSNGARVVDFNNNTYVTLTKDNSAYVRAIRAF
jgi:hypothetical protein